MTLYCYTILLLLYNHPKSLKNKLDIIPKRSILYIFQIKLYLLLHDDIDIIIPHQANQRIVDSASKRIGISNDKVFVNLHKYGNTSGASIPMALCEARDEGRLKKGDKAVLVGFGGGLTWGAALIEY